ncbi:MAG TPA: HNH endonuclease signature motif containing protein [Gemmatimonadaceae bacterium]|jgi:5-methylcytosine-specific restriction endonuclease McrA|nr:HNH endonuclease signature motif containing protein [Gemmatimonadaceae bacterium]
MVIDYEEYLASPLWRVRAATMRALTPWCALCPATRQLEVHHRTYDRVGRERPSDLVVLCARCHRRHHGTFEQERQMMLPFVELPDVALPKAA